MSIDLSQLEACSSSFRSDELFFIRLTSPYIATIFRAAFGRSNRTRLKYIRDILSDKAFDKGDGLYLRQALAPRYYVNNSPRPIDATNGPFRRLIEKITEFEIIKHFESTLRLQFGIYERFCSRENILSNLISFEDAIICLVRRRNFLEHFEKPPEKAGKKSERDKYNEKRRAREKAHSDDELISALGLFLLPDIFHLFLGRIASHEAKIGQKTQNTFLLREKIKSITKTRREFTKRRFEQELTRANIKDKSYRKKLVLGREKWRDAYGWLQDDKTDYRQNEFRLRYFFIGEHNINEIVKFLQSHGAAKKLHFKSEIEAFYILSVNINLIIHRFLQNVPKDEKDHIELPDPEMTKAVTLIRNTIAHNGLFWRVQDGEVIMSVAYVFETLLAVAKIGLIKKPHDSSEPFNDLFSSIERLLRAQNYSTVYLEDPQPTFKYIHRWKEAVRKTYGENRSEKVRLDKRKTLRKVSGKWLRYLQKAKLAIEANN